MLAADLVGDGAGWDLEGKYPDTKPGLEQLDLEERDVSPVGKKGHENTRKERKILEECVDVVFVDGISPPPA